MAMTPIERTVYVVAPWVFGIVLTLSGIVATVGAIRNTGPRIDAILKEAVTTPQTAALARLCAEQATSAAQLPGIALICSGLICTSLFCLSSILIKSAESKDQPKRD